MRNNLQTVVMLLIAAVFLGVTSTADAQDHGTDPVRIDLGQVLSQRQVSSTVESARLRLESAQVAAERAGIGSDPSFTVSPTTKLSGDEGNYDPVKATLTATLGLSVPLGLSADQRMRAAASVESLETARVALLETELSSIQRVIRLYHSAYLAQRELHVSQAELEAARLELDSEHARFGRGDVRFVDFLRVENEFSRAEATLSAAGVALREAVLELSVATGIPVAELENLQKPALLYTDQHSDEPSGLQATLHDNAAADLNAAVLARVFAVDAAERAASERTSIFSISQARASLDYMEHAAGLSFSPSSRVLGLSYTPEGVVLRDDSPSSTSSSSGSGGSGSSDLDWGLTLSVSFALSPARVDARSHDIARIAAEQARLELAEERLKAAAAARNSELELLQAVESVNVASAAVDRAVLNLGVVQARALAQQARPADVRSAEAALERSILTLERAELLRDQKYIEPASPAPETLRLLSASETWRIQ